MINLDEIVRSLGSEVLSFAFGGAATLLAGHSLGHFRYRRLTRFLRRRGLHQNHRDFVFPSLSIRSKGLTKKVASESDLITVLEAGRQHGVVVLTGEWGTGKTYLGSQLVARASVSWETVGLRCGVFIDAGDLRSPDIQKEVVRLIQQYPECADFADSTVSRSLTDPSLLLVIDALDQQPYAFKGADLLDDIVRFAEAHIERSGGKCMVILVIRSELLEVIPRFSRLETDLGTAVVEVMGFQEDPQIDSFLRMRDPENATLRLAKIQELRDQNPERWALVRTPQVLSRFVEIPAEDLKKMVPSAASLARIFRDSFAGVDEETFAALRHIGFELYKRDTYRIDSRALPAIPDDPPGRSVRRVLERTALFVHSGNVLQFRHASLRDYFAAEHIVDALIHGTGAGALSARPPFYLVSEFVAGLIDYSMLLQLLVILDTATSENARVNVLDIVSELSDPGVKDLAGEAVKSRLANVQVSPNMNGMELLLVMVGGVFGVSAPTIELITVLRQGGLPHFTREFYATRDSFHYYGRQQDRALREWSVITTEKKYGYVRHIMCFLLGEFGKSAEPRALIDALQTVAQDPENDPELHKLANEALAKLAGGV